MKKGMRMPPLVAILALILGACGTPPQVVTVSPSAPVAETAALSKAAAAVGAASRANEQNPAGLPKTAVSSELSVANAALPEPSAADAAAAQARVDLVLAGKLDEAQKAYAAAQTEAANLRAQVERERAENAATLKATFERLEREKNAAVQAAKDEAAREQRRLLNLIFHGVGGVLVLAGIGCFTFLSAVPFAGPRVGLGLIAAGAMSIGAGLAVNWALSNPWIVWLFVGLGGAVVLVVVGMALVNHWRDANQPAPAKPDPVVTGFSQ